MKGIGSDSTHTSERRSATPTMQATSMARRHGGGEVWGWVGSGWVGEELDEGWTLVVVPGGKADSDNLYNSSVRSPCSRCLFAAHGWSRPAGLGWVIICPLITLGDQPPQALSAACNLACSCSSPLHL